MLHAAYGTNFSRKTHLATHAGVGIDGLVHIAADDGSHHAEIRGRIGNAQSAGNVQEHVLLNKFKTHALLKHSKQHAQTAVVETRCRALGGAIGGSADQRLRLNEQWARAFHGTADGYATQALALPGEQQFAGIEHLSQTALHHLVDAQLARTSKAIFDASKDAIHVMLIALELQDAIHNVLQHLRTSKCSLLGDVTD